MIRIIYNKNEYNFYVKDNKIYLTNMDKYSILLYDNYMNYNNLKYIFKFVEFGIKCIEIEKDILLSANQFINACRRYNVDSIYGINKIYSISQFITGLTFNPGTIVRSKNVHKYFYGENGREHHYIVSIAKLDYIIELLHLKYNHLYPE